MQTSMDPRSGFYQAVAAEQAAATPAPAPEAESEPTPAKKVWQATANQRRWIENMIKDRFLPEEAERRISLMNWDVPDAANYVNQSLFNKTKRFLQNTPTLKQMGIVIEAPKGPAFPADLMHGTYTVQFADGSYRVLKINKQGQDEEFKPGVVLLSYMTGPNNEKDFRGFGEVTPEGTVKIWFKHRNNVELLRALDALLGRPQAGDEDVEIEHSGICAACTTKLTAPVSENPYRDLGYGPKCGKRIFG